jgi:NAD dependent epimerase/dehydratase family enzyme
MGTMAYLGSGKQFANWVHIEDVVGFISETLFHEKRHGIYNVVAPNNCTHFTFMKKVAASHHAYLMPIGVPALLLKAVLGSEKASVLIGGGNVSAERILKSGFHFKYPTLDEALNVLK